MAKKKVLDTRTIFIDKDGKRWNAVALQELVNACKHFSEFVDYIKFYY